MRALRTAIAGSALVITPALLAAQQPRQPLPTDYPQHSMARPRPVEVTPGLVAGGAPSDAVVLFDGRDLSAWVDDSGRPARWTVGDGWFAVNPGTGDIHTTRAFGDVQLHVEWSAPVPPTGTGQDRGNSGVYLQRTFEVQVLDSYHADTYADGQAGAIYGQYPPLVNPIRPPGEWNSYDILFHAPRWNPDGTLLAKARMTVLMNGIVIQDDVELTGPTAHQERPPYTRIPAQLSLELQDHHHPVRYRNIWVRELP